MEPLMIRAIDEVYIHRAFISAAVGQFAGYTADVEVWLGGPRRYRPPPG